MVHRGPAVFHFDDRLPRPPDALCAEKDAREPSWFLGRRVFVHRHRFPDRDRVGIFIRGTNHRPLRRAPQLCRRPGCMVRGRHRPFAGEGLDFAAGIARDARAWRKFLHAGRGARLEGLDSDARTRSLLGGVFVGELRWRDDCTAAGLLHGWQQLRYHWQFSFIATGASGFVLLAAWLWLYNSPEQHPWLSALERSTILNRAKRGRPSPARSEFRPSNYSLSPPSPGSFLRACSQIPSRSSSSSGSRPISRPPAVSRWARPA